MALFKFSDTLNSILISIFNICRATFLQCEENRVNKVTTESLAKPAIIRASDGKFIPLFSY